MDKKTTDKGWAAMRKMLDREMPEKPRRRFGWWWFGLLLLPIVGYGSWQWLSSPVAPTQKFEDKSAQPLANTAPAAEYKSADQSEQNAQISTTETNVISNNKPVSKTWENATSVLNTEVAETNSSSVPALPNPDLATLQKLSNHPSAEITANNSAAPAPVQLSLNLLPITPQSIDLQNIGKFSQPLLATVESPKPIKKSASNRWAFGASSAISTEQFNTINGFTTGLTVDWKFARKWGLRTGVLYNIHTPQEKYRPVASVLSADYRSNVSGDVIVVDLITGQEVTNLPNNNLYGDNVFIPVNRLQRLEVPLTVFWQAVRPLKIIGGLSLTRTLSAKADKQNYSGDYILKLADQTAEDGASKLSSSELDNWSADATLGAGVQLGKSFELGLSAKLPLSKFPGIAKTNQPGTNAGFADQSLGSTRKQIGPVFSLYGTLFF